MGLLLLLLLLLLLSLLGLLLELLLGLLLVLLRLRLATPMAPVYNTQTQLKRNGAVAHEHG